MNFDFINKIRVRKELTIKELAALTKISAVRIGKIERNKVDPKASELEALLKVLDYKMIAKDKINTHRHEDFECINGK